MSERVQTSLRYYIASGFHIIIYIVYIIYKRKRSIG